MMVSMQFVQLSPSGKGGLASETPKLLWVSQETAKMSKTQSIPGKSQAKVELELKL